MNHLLRCFLLSLLGLATVCCVRTSLESPGEIARNFSGTPPEESRPWVWWHWMDGNISKEGIRKDLFWMKEAGIAGLHQFDAGGRRTPQIVDSRVPYLSEEWKEDFSYAIRLADSLGIEVAVASCPGWSSTGGPWVKRENAMKKLVWRSTITRGGTLNLTLPEPFSTVGRFQDAQGGDTSDIEPWYEDIAAVAVRIPDKELSLEELGARVSSSDGDFTLGILSDGKLSTYGTLCPEEGYSWIRYDFPRMVTFMAATVCSDAMRGRYIPVPADVHLILECSESGTDWREVALIPDDVLGSMTVDFPETTAAHWRLKILPGEGSYARKRILREFVLHPVRKVNHSEEKSGFAAQHDFMDFPTPDSGDAITDVIPLGLPDKEGKISCDLPEGRWKIYRFGQALTGKKNHPASADATGLEVDKLDPEAWLDHFHSYLDLYKEASGGLIGSRGIRYILTDSYEAEQMTWTKNMFAEFSSRKGYDLHEWLPALAGEILVSSAQTEKFLWDWREVIGDLFKENYDRINDIVDEYGMMGRFTEAHELGRLFVGDGMDIKMTASVPMSAIWMEDTPTGHRFSHARMDIKESSSTAHVFGQNIAAAEAFTVSGVKGHAYTYSPENLKRTADFALWNGLNRFVVHDSAHQPRDDKMPGTGLFQYGQWFNRHETWSSMARSWTDYLSRSCYMLSRGRYVADILWYYGEDNCITGLYGINAPKVPEGYSYDFVNPKGLLSAVKARKGRLVTPSGMEYRVLVLGENCRRMSVPVLKKIVSLASKGITVCGTVPEEGAGRLDDPEEFARLKSKLERMISSGDLAKILSASGVSPDLLASADSVGFVHRTLPGMDIYWVRNFSKAEGTADVGISMRVSGAESLEVWNPEDGKRLLAEEPAISSGRVSVTLPMDKHTALFLVARKDKADPALPAPETPGVAMSIPGPWTVKFQEGRGVPGEVRFENLEDWSLNKDEGIRFFSGEAVYKTEVILNQEVTRAVLDLGTVKNIAEVSVNGTPCGTAWRPPFRVEVPSGILKEGPNEISVKVANLWVNRIIGDMRGSGGRTRTVTPQAFYSADSPLLSSGLIGPVVLEY